jgi:hypothetical protein
MRNLDLEALHVETTVMQPELEEGFDGGDYAASVLYNTLTQPMRPNPTTTIA